MRFKVPDQYIKLPVEMQAVLVLKMNFNLMMPGSGR